MDILVIRHGQPDDESQTGGQGDPPLSDLGRRQADAIGEFLAGEGVDHVVASPLVRAHHTALPLCDRLGVEPELVDDLKEAGWQAGAYIRGEENMAYYMDAIRNDPEFLYRPEGRDAFNQRVMRAFRRIRSENPGGTVAVFCHGMVTTTFVATILGYEPDPRSLHPHYTGLTRVRASAAHDWWSLQSFNETMHLAGIAHG